MGMYQSVSITTEKVHMGMYQSVSITTEKVHMGMYQSVSIASERFTWECISQCLLPLKG